MKTLAPIVILLILVLAQGFAQVPVEASTGTGIPGDAPPFISALKLSASPVFPVGTTGEMYRLGGGGTFSVHHRLRRLTFLNFYTGIGFRAHPLLDQSTSLLLSDLSVGAGLEFEIVPRLNFEAAVSGGVYVGNLLEPPESGYGGLLSFGASVGYDISGRWRLGVGGTYRSYFGLVDQISVDLIVSYRTDFILDDPFAAELPVMEPFYPALVSYYDQGIPMGRLTLINQGGAAWQKLQVGFDAQGITRGKNQVPTPESLSSSSPVSIGLVGDFGDSRIRRAAGDRIDTRITIGFRYKGWPQEREIEGSMSVYDAPFTTDPASAALFVASQDPMVLEWSSRNTDIDLEVSSELNRALVTSAAVYDSLRLADFDTVVSDGDIWQRITGTSGNLEMFPFPRETLVRRSGDRSESAILFAALLEASGISSGLAVIDGNLWPAAALDEGEERILADYARPKDLVLVDGIGWGVIDTSDPNGIVAALSKGAEAWHSSASTPIMIRCREAWKDYPQTGFSLPEGQIDHPDEATLKARFASSIDGLIRWEIEARRRNLLDAIAVQPRDTDRLNSLGALLARYGLRDEAVEWFDRVLLIEDDPRSLVNMGNIEYLKGDLTRARTYYTQASRMDPFNPYVLLGIARVSFEQENFGSSRDAYSKLEIVDPDLADRFAVLTGTGPDALQAALDSELRRVVFWLD